MSRIESALNDINTAIEALELLAKKEVTDFVSDECISMLQELVRQEMASKSDIIRNEIQQPRRKAA